MTPSVVLDQLEALRTTYPEAPLVVFVPRSQLGHSLETALARRQDGWTGVQIRIPRQYATDAARADILRSGREEAPVEGHLFRVARILQQVPAEETGTALPGWHLLARTVAGAIDTLREGDVAVEAVVEHAGSTEASETLGVVAQCYETYVRELQETGLYDDANVFEWATTRVTEGAAPGVRETVFAAVSAADLSEHEGQFLRALAERGRAFYRLGAGPSDNPPPSTVAARFSGADGPPLPSEAERGEGGDEPVGGDRSERFIRTVGAANEVKAVFRDLLEEEVPFGEATIAYTTSQPYASLIADEADRVGIPVTMGTGLPADHTRTGRALRGLFEWARDEFAPEHLIRMLRSGLLRTDRWLDRTDEDGEAATAKGEDASLRPHEAATRLAERSYEPGAEGLVGGLRAARQSLQGTLERRHDGTIPSSDESRLAALTLLTSYVEDLVQLFREANDVPEMANKACAFLEIFGPTDRPSADEAERTPDEAARALLYDRLERLGELDLSCEASESLLAALFSRWLEGQYVQAESPRPGRVHVLPLESAGYSDRSHLYVVGLDSSTFSAPFPESGMLQESDRRVLVSSLDPVDAGENTAGDVRPHTAADDVLWQAERALRRHRGPTVFVSRIFDVEAGEERDPSSLFLQHERASRRQDGARNRASGESVESSVVELVPRSSGVALSDGECWLRAYRRGREGGRAGPVGREAGRTARDALGVRYPWLLAGEAAREARRSDEYTIHDGLLPEGQYSALRLLDSDGRPLSASRLETLAEAPYIYFLKYILGVRPLEEPATDDEPWLNHLRKGTLLHRIYERFVRSLDGASPTPSDAEQLDAVVEAVLEKECEEYAPPSPVVKASAHRTLRENASIFLQAEVEWAPDHVPELLEWGFGLPPYRRQAEDHDAPAYLTVGDASLLLRGRIDRVDRNRATGAISAWDYKTGGSSDYDESDPLQDGKTLQWALYAYALEELRGETVQESGYFFANVREMGRRISASPSRYREDVEALLQHLDDLAESGAFPMTPHLHKVNAWKWGGYDWLVQDLRARRDELKEKEYPEARPVPRSF